MSLGCHREGLRGYTQGSLVGSLLLWLVDRSAGRYLPPPGPSSTYSGLQRIQRGGDLRREEVSRMSRQVDYLIFRPI